MDSFSYFRIGDKRIPITHKGHYVGSNLQSVLNEEICGIVKGTAKDRRESLSHFKMEIVKRSN